TRRSRSTAELTSRVRPCVITAARSTDGIVDPAVEVGWELRPVFGFEVEDEFTVSFRSGQPRVYDPGDACPPLRRGGGNLAQYAPLHLGVAHDAFRHLGAARLELRLHEHEGVPARSR